MNHVDQHAVSSALNSAVDEVVELAKLPDTGTVDALNLVVNIALHRLFTDPQATVQVVVADCYSAATVSEIVDWIGS